MKAKFLLICGVPAVGKSTIIAELKKIDRHFVYIKPYTNRRLRNKKEDKLHASNKKMLKMSREGKFVCVNKIFGNKYATPKEPIMNSFDKGKFPILDFPIDKIYKIENKLPGKLFCVYLVPVSTESVISRIRGMERDNIDQRIAYTEKELTRFEEGRFDTMIDYRIISRDKKTKEIAKKIYDKYMSDIS